MSLSAFGSCPPPWYLRRGLRFPAPPLVPQVNFMISDGAASFQGTKVTGARAVGPLGPEVRGGAEGRRIEITHG